MLHGMILGLRAFSREWISWFCVYTCKDIAIMSYQAHSMVMDYIASMSRGCRSGFVNRSYHDWWDWVSLVRSSFELDIPIFGWARYATDLPYWRLKSLCYGDLVGWHDNKCYPWRPGACLCDRWDSIDAIHVSHLFEGILARFASLIISQST